MGDDLEKFAPISETVFADQSEIRALGVAALPEKLGRYARAHQRALHMSNYLKENGEIKLSSNLKQCGHWLVFRHYYTKDELRLHSADFCKKHLLCPLCAVRRAGKYLKAYLDRFTACMSNFDGKATPYMVTLTIKDGEDLTERFNHLRAAMRAQLQARRNYFKNPSKRRHFEICKALGGVHSVEAKRGKNSGLWHPHVHMVWLCESPPDARKLSEEWEYFTKDSKIVDVRPFYGDSVDSFLEIFKYALKFSDLSLPDNFQAFRELSGKRLVDSFGCFKGVKVDEDLTDGVLEDLPYIEMFYQYLGREGYTLAKVKKFDWSDC